MPRTSRVFSLISRLAKQAFFWLGATLFSVFIGVLVKGFQGDDPEKFTQGLVTLGGIAVAIAGLGYVLAQSLEGQPKVWINRKSGNMFAPMSLRSCRTQIICAWGDGRS